MIKNILIVIFILSNISLTFSQTPHRRGMKLLGELWASPTVATGIPCEDFETVFPKRLNRTVEGEEFKDLIPKYIEEISSAFNIDIKLVSVVFFTHSGAKSPAYAAGNLIDNDYVCERIKSKYVVLLSTEYVSTLKKIKNTENLKDELVPVLSHEIAHILQDIRKCSLDGMKMELQADFLAGWYAYQHFHNPRRYWLKDKEKEILDRTLKQLSVFFFYGDSSASGNKSHGLPEIRMISSLRGYYLAREVSSPDKAYDEGLSII